MIVMHLYRASALAVVVLLSFSAERAEAAAKRMVVIEAKGKAKGPVLAKGIRAALKVNHGYQVVKEDDFFQKGKSLGLSQGAALSPIELRKVAQAVGADFIVLARATAQGKGFTVHVRVDAVGAGNTVMNQKYTLAGAKLDRVTATNIARDVRSADVGAMDFSGDAAGGDAMDFSGDGGGDKAKAQAQAAANEGFELTLEEPSIALNVTEVKKAAAEAQGDVAAESGDDDEFLEPTEDLGEEGELPRYVSGDGRSGLVLQAGLSMRLRRSLMSSLNGTPPRYEGTLSPGVAVAVSLFPRRFKEGGGIARDFGAFGRAEVVFMPSQLLVAGVASNYTDRFLSLQGGLAYKHVFGVQEKAIALGAQLGIAFDQVSVTDGLPFPAVSYVSPLAAVELEAPVLRKLLVVVARAGVLPITGVGQTTIDAFGTRQWAFGLTGTAGLQTTMNDLFFAQAMFNATSYLQSYSGQGASGFRGVGFRDLLIGFQLTGGIAY